MHRNDLSLHRKTATAQQDLERLIDKLILYLVHAFRLSIKYKYPPLSIIAMNEAIVWNYVVSNTTINKQGVKTEHENCMANVCSVAKVDDTKLKPFVVFCATKI